MILTRYDRLMIDELPKNVAEGLDFLTDNYYSIMREKKIDYPNKNLSYEILRDFLDDEQINFRSHREFIYCYFILSGEEIIEINDVDELDIFQEYNKKSDCLLYKGLAQSRIRLQRNSIIILYPEDAYRFHYVPKYPCTKFLIKIPISKEV